MGMRTRKGAGQGVPPLTPHPRSRPRTEMAAGPRPSCPSCKKRGWHRGGFSFYWEERHLRGG